MGMIRNRNKVKMAVLFSDCYIEVGEGKQQEKQVF